MPTGLIVAGIATGIATAGSSVYAAKKQSDTAKKGAEIAGTATTHAADLQSKATADALAFSKKQAQADYENQELARRGNYDQYAAEERRKSTIAQMFGLPSRETPAYVPSKNPNYLNVSAPNISPTIGGAAKAAAAPQAANPNDMAAQISKDWADAHGGAAIPQDVLQQYIGYSSKPDLYSDQQWRIGYNPYLRARMLGLPADPSMAGTAGIIAPPVGYTGAPPATTQRPMGQAMPYRGVAVSAGLQMPTFAGMVR